MQKKNLFVVIAIILTVTLPCASVRSSRMSQVKKAAVAEIRPTGSGVSVAPEQLGPHSAAVAQTHRPTAGRLGPVSFVLGRRCAFLVPVTGPGKITITASWKPTNCRVEACVFCPGIKDPVARTTGTGRLTLTVPWVHTATGPRPRTGDWMVELGPASDLTAGAGQSTGPSIGPDAAGQPVHQVAGRPSSKSTPVTRKKSEPRQVFRPRKRDGSPAQMKPVQGQLRDRPSASVALISGTLTVRGPGLGSKALTNVTARQAELSRALSAARSELDAIRTWQLQWEEADVKQIFGEWAVLNVDDLAGSIESTENWIDKLESQMERERALREEFNAAFQNFDQKTKQLFNILSQVLKDMKEIQTAIMRNLL